MKGLIKGGKYFVREWDGSVNKVTIVGASHELVTIEYEDGLVNQVSHDYFTKELNARLSH